MSKTGLFMTGVKRVTLNDARCTVVIAGGAGGEKIGKSHPVI